MRSPWKFAAGIVAFVVAAIVVLLVLAKVMITPERVKAMVVPLAETTLQRKGFATFLQLPELDQINFKDFRGKVRIVDGRVAIDSALLSPHLKLFPAGTLGLDGSLDLAMDTRLSPELAARLDQRGQVVKFLADADGWSRVPLLLTGTCQAPRFGLDPKGVRAQAARALQQQLQRGIDRLLNRPLSAPPAVGPPPQTTPPPPEPAGQPSPTEQQKPPTSPPQQKSLEEALHQLLGR